MDQILARVVDLENQRLPVRGGPRFVRSAGQELRRHVPAPFRAAQFPRQRRDRPPGQGRHRSHRQAPRRRYAAARGGRRRRPGQCPGRRPAKGPGRRLSEPGPTCSLSTIKSASSTARPARPPGPRGHRKPRRARSLGHRGRQRKRDRSQLDRSGRQFRVQTVQGRIPAAARIPRLRTNELGGIDPICYESQRRPSTPLPAGRGQGEGRRNTGFAFRS